MRPLQPFRNSYRQFFVPLDPLYKGVVGSLMQPMKLLGWTHGPINLLSFQSQLTRDTGGRVTVGFHSSHSSHWFH